jgi:hypothetical protein
MLIATLRRLPLMSLSGKNKPRFVGINLTHRPKSGIAVGDIAARQLDVIGAQRKSDQLSPPLLMPKQHLDPDQVFMLAQIDTRQRII